jgi:hypothetical protein
MTTDIQAVLDCPMQENDSGAATIKGYLKALLFTLWDEEECFSGKRPFGNSGWTNDIAVALVDGGFIKGSVYSEVERDEVLSKYLGDADYPAMNKIIQRAIEAL